MHRIIDLREAEGGQLERAAQILLSALSHAPSAWKDLASASDEVRSTIDDPERFGLLVLEDGEVRGWIGAIKQSAHAWELHPLVVDPSCQRQGWGQLLVEALESAARSEGVLTIWLGTDDDFGGTNLYGRDLYPDVLGALQQLRATNGHPFTFYERLGYHVTGVFPDVDGAGKHDILMAKRISG
jgi:aminoglycoside 6'-N-acetyltransferase I